MACRVVSRAPNPYIARNAYVAACLLRVPITRAYYVPIARAYYVPIARAYCVPIACLLRVPIACLLRVPIAYAHCVPIAYAHCVPYIAPDIRLYALRDTPINPSVSNGLPHPACAPRLGGVY